MRFFVYGTLTDAETAASVLDEFTYRDRVTLRGLRRVDGAYPTLAPGGETPGRVLATDRVDALDRYEGVDSGLYVRVGIPHRDGGPVHAYVGDPEALDAPATWPGDGPFRERVSTYVADHDVRVVPASRD